MQMDEFYSRCCRLSGYGLALALDKTHGSMGNPDDFAFRITLLGKRLVDMLVSGSESTEITKLYVGLNPIVSTKPNVQ
jgi:hypothetical protein